MLRGTGRISEQTREKVLSAAQKLRSIPDGRAASMRSGQSREVGLAIHQIANPFNTEVPSGVGDLLDSEGCLVSVLDARDDAGRRGRHLAAFIRNGRGGLPWVPEVETPTETFGILAAHGIPTVTFLRRPAVAGFDHVGIRNAEATASATAHLAELGHRHIAYLGGTEMSAVRKERVAGHGRVMAERGLPPPVIRDSLDSKLAGLNAMLDLLRANPETTAVVCKGDIVALGACLAPGRSGLAPGRDMSVVGFDDSQDAATANPPLTTTAVAPCLLGRRLVRVLLERMREPHVPVSASEISAELVVRQTAGPKDRSGQGPS